LNNKIPHGFGILRFFNGDVYEGPFRYGMMHGLGGQYVSSSGSKSKGEFRENLKYGSGEEMFQNGDRYVGHFEHGRPHGFGVRYTPCGEVYCSGARRSGKPVTKAAARVTFADDVRLNGTSAIQRTDNRFERFGQREKEHRISSSCDIVDVHKAIDAFRTGNNCKSSDSIEGTANERL
jgi:hypothetical protein